MKKIYILLLAALFFSQLTYAKQGLINKLTEQEFYQIKINDIPILDLMRTRGDYTKLKAMFGDDLQYEYDEVDIRKEYKNSKIDLVFEDADYSLQSFVLHYPTTLTVKGKKVKIGDDVSALGLVLVDTSNGEYTVDYIDERTHTAFVSIKIIPETKKIIEIVYILF
jgi:hypothetical protein